MMQDEDLALYFAIRPMPDGHQVDQVIRLGLAEGLYADVLIQAGVNNDIRAPTRTVSDDVLPEPVSGSVNAGEVFCENSSVNAPQPA